MISATSPTLPSEQLPMGGLKRRIQLFCLVASSVLGFLTSAGAKPTISFTLPPSLQGFPSLTPQTRWLSQQPMKTYSGQRVSNSSLLMIYYHDQTIAVVELGPHRLLLNCELIEIRDDDEGQRLLQDLSRYNRPLEISFDEMLKLMGQCEFVDKLVHGTRPTSRASSLFTELTRSSSPDVSSDLAATIVPRNPLSIFSGIIPGTKWCGTGDIADTYHDLGTKADMDRCCRQHDLCPVKIRAYQNKYGLANNSLYTKSHCICDDMLFDCLKVANTTGAQLLGSIYFNLVQVPCLDGRNNRYTYRPAREGF